MAEVSNLELKTGWHRRSVEIQRRSLTDDEAAALTLLLSVEFEGVADLREQGKAATVTGRCDTVVLAGHREREHMAKAKQ